MKRQQWGLYAVALAILVIGLAWAGVPVDLLPLIGLVLACPLMMIVMMRGMHDGDTPTQDRHDPNGLDHQHRDDADRAHDLHGAGHR